MKKILIPLFLLLTAGFYHSASSQGLFQITTDSFEVETGQTIQIPVKASNFTNIIGLNFSIFWDSNVLQFNSVSNRVAIFNPGPTGDPVSAVYAAQGLICVNWGSVQYTVPGCVYTGNNMPDTTVFVLNFTVVGNPGTSTNIDFGSFQGELNGVQVFCTGYIWFAANSTYTQPPYNLTPCGYACPSDGQSGFSPTCSFGPSGFVQLPPDTSINIACPANVSTGTSASTCAAVVNDIGFQLPPNPDTLSVFYTLSGATTGSGFGNVSGSVFQAGTTTVTYSAAYATGDTVSCSFTVLVEDTTPPVFDSCPGDIVQVAAAGDCGAPASWTVPVATDNCGAPQVTASHNPGHFFPVGQTTVTYTATDNAGNQTICSFQVIVLDQEFPQIQNCPEDIVVTASNGSCSAQAFWTLPTATDNCSAILGSGGFLPGDSFPFGVTTVSYFAFDPSGNETQCSFTVTVLDGTPPEITCPGNVLVETDGSFTVLNIAPLAVSGNCDNNPTVQYTLTGATTGGGTSDASGTNFMVGTTLVTYTATDSLGTSASCSFNVTIIDTLGPVTCPSSIIISTEPDVCFATVLGLSPSLREDVVSVSYTLTGATTGSGTNDASGTAFNLGQTDITYIVTTSLDLTDSCTFSVIVQDNQPPAFKSCPTDTTIVVSAGSCMSQVFWDDPEASDNCDTAVIITSSHQPGDTFGVGATVVTYTASDASGNETQCSFTVTILDTVPPVITCIDSVQVGTDPGTCSAIVNDISPEVEDDCEIFTLTYMIEGATEGSGSGSASGLVFNLGESKLTYTVTDISGNTAACSMIIIVEDDQAPVFTGCPTDTVVLFTLSNSCVALAAWDIPIATDNCTSPELTSNFSLSDSLPLGHTTVVYQAEDAAGNITQCSFVVQVIDAIPPVFTSCPSNITVPAGNDVCDVVVSWTIPEAIDNCSGVSITSNFNSGDTFSPGTTLVVYTAEDESGNQSTCSFEVVVIDTTAPVITSCPAATITATSQDGTCGATASWTPPTATDNCSQVTLNASHNPGDFFPVGSTQVTYTFEDASGNISSCSFNVEVLDQTSPVFISCPSDLTVFTQTGTCQGVANWPLPTAEDDCGSVSLTSNFNPGNSFPLGQTVVIYEATDAAGNSQTCSFTVTVIDNQAPVVSNCPQNITVASETAACGATVTWSTPSFIDNCSDVSVVSNFQPGDFFPVGTTMVTYTATDANGNSSTCSFSVIVEDQEAPALISCPPSITTSTDPGACHAIVSWTIPTFEDNCPGLTISSTHNPDDIFLVGTTTVTYTTQDASGNTTTCSFDITVEDNEAPQISCPEDIQVVSDTSVFISDLTPAASDNCGITSITYFTSGVTILSGEDDISGSLFNEGETFVSYVAFDAAGNSDTCIFTVTVLPGLATIECPLDVVIASFADTCGVFIEGLEVVIVDSASGVSAVAYEVTGATTVSGVGSASDVFFHIGVSTVTYMVENTMGNVTTCTFTVTIEDTTPPMFTNCPLNISISSLPDSCGAIVSWTPPTASDNCTIASVTSTHNPGDFFELGVTEVMYIVTDEAGLSDTCTFTITVEDTTPPMFTGCPADISISSLTDSCGAIVSWTPPTATDNCAIASVTSTHNPGDFFELGVTEVMYIVTDEVGLSDTCTFTITVEDTTPPMFTGCSADISISSLTDSCGTFVSWTPPTASDNCAIASVTSTHNPGDFFELGVTEVMYIVTDEAGLSDTCTFTITVEDTTPPMFTDCPAAISISSLPDSCGAIVSWTPPTATDNCAIASVTSTHNPGDFFELGTTEVIYILTDLSGLSDTCSFTVTVEDIFPPIFTNCPAAISISSLPDSCGAIVSWTPPTATDNCAIASVTSTHNPGDFFELGVTEVMYIVTDEAGLTHTCTFTITVEDTTPPMFTDCPADISISSLPDSCGAIVSWTPPTATDNCAIASVTSTHNPGDFFELGTTEVMYIVTDDAGLSDTCTFTITVEDTTPPMFTNCPADIEISVPFDHCNVAVSWTSPVATDNCSVASVTSTHEPGDLFEPGITQVTYVVTDVSGLMDTCTFTVSVIDTHPPVLSCPADTVVPAESGLCGAELTSLALTATDNCGIDTVTYEVSGATQFSGNGLSVSGFFNVGVSVVTYTVTDLSGNTSQCSFGVEILDTEPPVLISCPGNITVNVPSGACSAVINWTPPTAEDNCSVETLESTHQPGTVFSVGVSTVTYTVTDASGNTAQCSFVITLVDNQAPQISCPGDILISVDGTILSDPEGFISNVSIEDCQATISFDEPEVSDNCGIDTYIQTGGPASGSAFEPGVHTLVYVATDVNGNSSTCSFTIEVVNDLEQPVAEWLSGSVVCEGDVVELSTAFTAAAQYVWEGPNDFSSTEQNPFIVDAQHANDGIYTVYYILNGCPSPISEGVEVVVLESPEASDVFLSVPYDESLDMFSVTDNDFYDARAAWTITISAAPQHGELTDLGNGLFNYTPLNEYYGPDSFSYTVCYDACSEVCVTGMVYIEVIRAVFECEDLPTIITPNGDGFNDRLEIFCLESGAYPQNELIIFNEWGGEVFRASPYMNDWDGTRNGSDLPAGTYYYVFRESPDAEPHLKYLTIYR